MKALHKGVVLAAIHIVIVCSLGAKLLIDRAHYPRVWVKAAAYDPNLPIRGRYASVRLIIDAPAAQAKPLMEYDGVAYPSNVQRARLVVQNGKLIAIDDNWGTVYYRRMTNDQVQLYDSIAFFINERVKDPTVRAGDEELWVEVTVPRKGPPRPIRLAVKKNGSMQPLQLD
jgi:hypothetical protein